MKSEEFIKQYADKRAEANSKVLQGKKVKGPEAGQEQVPITEPEPVRVKNTGEISGS